MKEEQGRLTDGDEGKRKRKTEREKVKASSQQEKFMTGDNWKEDPES